MKPYGGYALLNLFSNFISVLFSLISFGLLIPFLGILFGTIEIVESAPAFEFKIQAIAQNLQLLFSDIILQHGKVQTLLYICIAVLIFYFFKTSFYYLALFFMAPIRSKVVRNIRNDIYDQVLILPLSYYSEKKKGDIITRSTNDIQQVELSVMNSLQIFFREPISIILYMLTLFIMSTNLTIFVLILLPITGYFIGRIAKSLRRKSGKAQEQLGSLLSMIEESITGLRIIKAFNTIWWADKNFKRSNEDYTRTMISIYRRTDLASPLSEFLSSIVVILIMLLGGQLVLGESASLEPEVFITYIVIFSQVITPAKSISTAYSNVQKGIASIKRIREIFDAEEKITQKPDAIEITTLEHSLEYKEVNFSYDHEKVLKDINLIVPKGKSIALAGPSGAGKSTLVDLIPRFYDCQSGVLLIDGKDIRDYLIDDIRGLTGIVSQETILFNDTVFNNIAFGIEDAKAVDVENAAKIANAHDFIMELDHSYQTVIGDRGSTLSGGQKQRISIARAVLRNPPILILDEATSSLDTESERLVQDALYKLMENRTSIIIAHRLSTIKHVDEIIVMNEGRLVERGNHMELYNQNGMYTKLIDLQSFH
ncbi:ABC transporter ATP-binding protein [candidate division KSB1 bacterium]